MGTYDKLAVILEFNKTIGDFVFAEGIVAGEQDVANLQLRTEKWYIDQNGLVTVARWYHGGENDYFVHQYAEISQEAVVQFLAGIEERISTGVYKA